MPFNFTLVIAHVPLYLRRTPRQRVQTASIKHAVMERFQAPHNVRASFAPFALFMFLLIQVLSTRTRF
jgi:hypothetical protein